MEQRYRGSFPEGTSSPASLLGIPAERYHRLKMASDGTQDENQKWWIDQSRAEKTPNRPLEAPAAGGRFYVAAEGYEQERARSGLVDSNRKMLSAGDPPEEAFGHLALIERRTKPEVIERIGQRIPLPPGGCGVIIESGKMLRVIVTGSPRGERILELNLNRGDPSFDAWIDDEWVEEISFRNLGQLYRAAPRLIDRYFGPGRIERSELLT